ncbi:flavodoxin family protein [Nocardia puris]|uniref:Multimeric flavodoxin WrbA n=1 Tax=Nocardia puris TaxID=208602 RepID=A0A366D940_9NOCA|nr:flavodoxin family protein [Nocardia puris]MBF6214046.1 flavodoxin family protein [Nocardia puris]MBF6368670.1 flavodoxin family protein [Nocardia puris]MBF6461572.1 flavodoxin family protein [Nocardia puris]RBO86553.1 multimeric flavodoxin WrbA [Nocardia puris]
MPEITVAVAYHSGFGHTARQAHAVAEGVGTVDGATAALCDVGRLGDPLWRTLDESAAIVFGTPTYMGSQSAVFQAFAEASAPVWAAQGWRHKLAAGFTNSAGVNGDKLNTLISLSLFAAQHGMTWVSLDLPPGWLYTEHGDAASLNRLGGFLGAMAQSPSDVDAERAPGPADLATAAHLGARVAAQALALTRGRAAVAR